MALLGYSVVRDRLRTYLSNRESLLNSFRLARCVLLQGPWQPWLIGYYRSRSNESPVPVLDSTLFPELEPELAVRRLRREAYAPGVQVPGAVIDEIVTWARAVGGKRIDEPHLQCEAVRHVAHDPRLVAVARGYLGAEPILLTSQIYWTVPPGTAQGNIAAAAEGGRFHYDLADILALTVFVYLTDVDRDCGPHIVVRGTQTRRTPAQILRRFVTDDEIERDHGDRVLTITGRRGTGWFEDISCYHKQAPAERVRGMMYLTYSLHRKRVVRGRPAR